MIRRTRPEKSLGTAAVKKRPSTVWPFLASVLAAISALLAQVKDSRDTLSSPVTLTWLSVLALSLCAHIWKPSMSPADQSVLQTNVTPIGGKPRWAVLLWASAALVLAVAARLVSREIYPKVSVSGNRRGRRASREFRIT
jgi:hypothetical protein